MNTKFVKIIILAVLYFTMTSCGNKGDLYMPDKQNEQQKEQQKEQPVNNKINP